MRCFRPNCTKEGTLTFDRTPCCPDHAHEYAWADVMKSCECKGWDEPNCPKCYAILFLMDYIDELHAAIAAYKENEQ